jgi:hypothetical protein
MVLSHLTTEKPKRICTFCYHYIKLMEKEKEKEMAIANDPDASPSTPPASPPATTGSSPSTTQPPLSIDPQHPTGTRENTKRALETYLANPAHPMRLANRPYIAGQGISLLSLSSFSPHSLLLLHMNSFLGKAASHQRTTSYRSTQHRSSQRSAHPHIF